MNNLSLGDTVEIKAKNKCHESPPQTVSFHGLTGCGLICFLRLSSPLLFFFFLLLDFIFFVIDSFPSVRRGQIKEWRI